MFASGDDELVSRGVENQSELLKRRAQMDILYVGGDEGIATDTDDYGVIIDIVVVDVVDDVDKAGMYLNVQSASPGTMRRV